MSANENSWLDQVDAEWAAMEKKWTYTHEVFTGEYSDQERVKTYLLKRAFWEKDDAYKLRISAADPDMLFSLIIGSIVGQLFAVESDEKRVWQRDGATQGLGSPTDPDTIIGRMWDNTDGAGTSWPVLWRRFATDLLVFQTLYVLVEGVGIHEEFDGEGNYIQDVQIGEAKITIIDPRMVTSKSPGARPSWVKVKHQVITGGDDPRSPQTPEDQYTVYELTGWTRYRKTKGGEEIIGQGEYEFYTTRDREELTLPIFAVRLPFPAYVAHYIARKAIALFNLESMRDTFLGESTTTHLIEEGDPMVYEMHKDDMAAGDVHHNFAPGQKAYYIAPPDGPARLASDVITDKRQNLFISAYQQYGNAAAETTATEIRQQARAGIEAFLSLFSASLEEAQNRATFLLEQVYFPDQPDTWGGAMVELSREFVPADPNAEAMALREMFFGPAAVPVDAVTLTAAAVRLIERKGFEVTDEQREALRSIYDALVTRRDGNRPRLAETAGRINDLVASFNGSGAGN
jgi:hypothetical protein